MLNQYHVCWNSRSGEKVSFQSENVWCGLGFHHASPPPTRTLFNYALDAENSIYSAYTTTKLKLGGSSPLVITPSEDVYVFLEKADRMRVLRPQLMSAKHLMNVGSRIVLGTQISLFHFVLSGWEREDSIRTSSGARWRTLRTKQAHRMI